MPSLVYDVAVSIDGYIAGPKGDISRFPMAGPHVDAYAARLAGYPAVIMGKNTYEFGYAYGLPSGERAYPHMEHLICSSSMKLPKNSAVTVACSGWLNALDGLLERHKTVYLCGGGMLAGFLLANQRITELHLKRVPIVLGQGIPLFAGKAEANARLLSTQAYENGVVYQHYGIG
ncbi:MAG: dihydrofolate reductase family protein [Rhodobacteraceae bacterium]|nr:dihydrofolate reductase family protein [Paracoccaceae bacterium]